MSWSRDVREPQASFDLAVRREVVPRSVTIRNLGDELVVDPRIVVNGRRDWFSVDTILDEILEPGQSDRDKAIAIWRFLVANRAHDTPTRDHGEMHHPVRLLNVYGYGFCDDTATSFMVLAEKAGLPARVVHLARDRHVVAEVYYDGDWHMFDPDGEVYYPVGPRKIIASVRWLRANPEIIRHYPSPVWPDNDDLIEIYSSGGHIVARWYEKALNVEHVMGFSLRPGELIERSWDNLGLHVEGQAGEMPAVFGNGRFVFEPVMREGVFKSGAAEVTHVRSARDADGQWSLIFAPRDAPARLTYVIESPYPVLGGEVRIGGTSPEGGRAWLEMAGDSQQWLEVWASESAGELSAGVALNEVLRRGNHRPIYRYWLRLSFEAAGTAEWQVEDLRYVSDFQLAPHSLPHLIQGDNEISYVDATEGNRHVELSFEYFERLPITP